MSPSFSELLARRCGRLFPDGRAACVYPLLYNRARLGIGKFGSNDFEDEW
jgi:hypothetical protein